MTSDIHVLIVEDDFRIAAIHKQYVDKENGYVVVDQVKTAQDTFACLQKSDVNVDLILLDIYIPDVEGLDLFWQLRTAYRDVDIAVVTAAAETETIAGIMRAGVEDYIVKPVDANRFHDMLTRYKQKRDFLASKETMGQNEIDMLMGKSGWAPLNEATTKETTSKPPKGIDPITLDEVIHLLQGKQKGKGITAVELSKQIGTSRSTARRYLEYLVSIKKIRTSLIYGSVGRPERQYILRETYEQNE